MLIADVTRMAIGPPLNVISMKRLRQLSVHHLVIVGVRLGRMHPCVNPNIMRTITNAVNPIRTAAGVSKVRIELRSMLVQSIFFEPNLSAK